jgi:hypothetical protein
MTEAYSVVNALSELTSVNSGQIIYWNIFVTVVVAFLGLLGTGYAQKQQKICFYFLWWATVFLQ